MNWENTSRLFHRTGCILTCILLLVALHNLRAQSPEENFRVAFYNLENLFHPDDDSLTNDEEFTPEGMRYWSPYRYHEKSNRMAKAILSIGEWSPPAIVGVAEIENRQVLEDLVNGEVLRKFNYEILHYESPDRRGIDVAMLYRSDLFQPLFSKNYPLKIPGDPGFASRDILYVKGYADDLDTLHMMVVHWPSRYGGQAQSEPKRIQAAITVKGISDSIMAHNPKAAVVIAGDFNDEWHNESLFHSLGAQPELKADTSSHLINLMASLSPNSGSHRYRGVWSYLDQVVVSSALLDGEGMEIRDGKAKVVRHDFLLETDEKFPGQKPFRSFIGMRYNGGFSDHLPVFIDLWKTVDP